MTAAIKTVIGQLSIAGGTWRGDPPNQVAVREPTSATAPGAGKGDLFVLTEVRGPVSKRDEVERQLAQAIRDAYYLARGSITASLRRALQAGNEQLYQHNRRAGKNERVVAGVVALAVRDRDAFVAQTGPAAFFAVLNGYIRRYPDKSAWLDEAMSPNQDRLPSALGLKDVLEPNLHHLRLSLGDTLILADGRLAGQMPLDTVLRSAEPHNAKATVKSLGQAARTRDGSALVLTVSEADQSALDTLKQKAPAQINRLFDRQRHQPATAQAAAPAAQASVAEAIAAPPKSTTATHAAPTRSRSVSRSAGRFFDHPAPADEAPANTRHVSRPIAVTQPPEPEYYDDEDELELSTGQPARTLASLAHASSFNTTHHEPKAALTVSQVLRWLGTSLLVLVALLGSGLKNILTLVLPRAGHQSRLAGAQAYRQQTPAMSWTTLRNIAIAIPLLVGLIVGVIYLQKGRVMEAEYTEFVTTAHNKFQQAQAIAAADPTTASGLITEAQAALVEAEKIKANQPEINDLRQQMSVAVDEIGHVQRLYYLPQLRAYTDPGTSLKTVLMQGVDVYVLDTGTDRIFHHQLDKLGETLLPDNESPVLVSRGQSVEQTAVNELVDMTWMPAGGNRQTSDLVILTGSGLLEYNSNWGLTTSVLANSDAAAPAMAVSSYFGNFYVLQPPGNPPGSNTGRLLRYLPTADGYSEPPEDYFAAGQQVDLTNAVDLAIDGAIYVLFKDGRLSKYQAGQPVEFNVTGLDKPFNNPVAVFTAPDEEVQYIYVADAGNQRVVQLEKDGRFVRQFKPRDGEAVSFANLQDIFVDEIGSRLYILDSNNLYVANIPTQATQ